MKKGQVSKNVFKVVKISFKKKVKTDDNLKWGLKIVEILIVV